MSHKKRIYQKRDFESTGAPADTSSNIYVSMLLSPAWIDLSAPQKVLYQACKAQLYSEKCKPEGNNIYFTINQSKWSELYKLYKKQNYAGFQRDMEALILHGFISCVHCGEHTRTKTVYAFSSMWRNYGTPEFIIKPTDKTNAMLRKERKSATATARNIPP